MKIVHFCASNALFCLAAGRVAAFSKSRPCPIVELLASQPNKHNTMVPSDSQGLQSWLLVETDLIACANMAYTRFHNELYARASRVYSAQEHATTITDNTPEGTRCTRVIARKTPSSIFTCTINLLNALQHSSCRLMGSRVQPALRH